LSTEDDELLAQEGILGYQFGFSPGKIPYGSEQQ